MKKWKYFDGLEIEVGDYIADLQRGYKGYIEYTDTYDLCLHVTHIYNKTLKKYEIVDNKGPKEAYQTSIYSKKKSNFYWWFHNYILPDLCLLGRERN